jgi:rod shape-determining protein MreD
VSLALGLLAGWLLAAVQASAMPYLHVLDVTPDLVLIYAASFAVLRKQSESIIVVPFCGLFHDLATSDPIGTSILGFAPLVILASVLQFPAMDSRFIPAAAIVAAGTVIHGAITIVVLALTGQEIALWYSVSRVVLPLTVVNTLFAAVVYLPLSWFRQEERATVLGSGRLTSPL